MSPPPLRFLLLFFAGWMSRQQADVIAYLRLVSTSQGQNRMRSLRLLSAQSGTLADSESRSRLASPREVRCRDREQPLFAWSKSVAQHAPWGQSYPRSGRTLTRAYPPAIMSAPAETVMALATKRRCSFDRLQKGLGSRCEPKTVNQAAARALNKPPHQLFGLLGGDAMECVFARRPEGCGRTVHCKTCSIRRAVLATAEQGVGLDHAPLQFTTIEGTKPLTISTQKVGELVRIQLHREE